MASRLIGLGGFAALGLALVAAPRALGCMPGCSGYHLTFTGPLGANGSALATADRDVTVTWDDPVDGASATFDILMSRQPVPAYPMHSFPAQLPGQVLALGLSATAQTSWTWDTSQVEPGTVFLYAVFHNSPFNTLVMPFAAVTIAHGSTTPSESAVLIRSPRGTSAVGGTVSISLDAAAGGPSATSPAAPGATVDLYVGSPPDAADGTLIAGGLAAGAGQTARWDSSRAGAGSYVFKAVLRDPSGSVLASALSPGIVEVDSNSASGGSCETGAGPLASGVLILLASLRLRRRAR
jgi:hypothetical protein